MKKLISLLLALVMVFAMAACTPDAPETSEPAAGGQTDEYTVLGEGATTIYVDVEDVDGTVTRFQVNTDAETVGEALLEVELIEGENGDYGLYINAVNGITADWETEKAYWSFVIDGEYAMTGVDMTPVVAETQYALVKVVSE